jgi:hypothetical protein
MKCKISWVEPGKPEGTADENEAVGLAICTSNMEFDAGMMGHVRAFPICEEHARKLKPAYISWPGTAAESVTTWKLLRFGRDI